MIMTTQKSGVVKWLSQKKIKLEHSVGQKVKLLKHMLTEFFLSMNPTIPCGCQSVKIIVVQ